MACFYELEVRVVLQLSDISASCAFNVPIATINRMPQSVVAGLLRRGECLKTTQYNVPAAKPLTRAIKHCL